MKYLEAKRQDEIRKRREATRQKVKERKALRPIYEDKSLPPPPEDKAEEPDEEEEETTEAEEWTLKMSPESYAKLHPEGKHAELARKLVDARDNDPEAG